MTTGTGTATATEYAPLRDLRRVVEARQKQHGWGVARLALETEVPPSQIKTLLAGGAPRGDAILRILAWVTGEVAFTMPCQHDYEHLRDDKHHGLHTRSVFFCRYCLEIRERET